jgi:hypothetical protein
VIGTPKVQRRTALLIGIIAIGFAITIVLLQSASVLSWSWLTG